MGPCSQGQPPPRPTGSAYGLVPRLLIPALLIPALLVVLVLLALAVVALVLLALGDLAGKYLVMPELGSTRD